MTNRGRKQKYDPIKTKKDLADLIFLFKKEKLHKGKLKISDLVNFSEKKHQENPTKYEFYNRDVWKVYGREIIDEMNKPPVKTISTTTDEVEIEVEVPNLAFILKNYYNDKEILSYHLTQVEVFIHRLLEQVESNELNKRKIQNYNELEKENKELKEKLKLQQQYIYEISVKSRNSILRDELQIENQISINANKRNLEIASNPFNFDTLFELKNQEEDKNEKQIKNKIKEFPKNKIISPRDIKLF